MRRPQTIAVARSHYEPQYPGDVRKLLINRYAENNPGDPQRPVRLVRTPGSRDIDTGNVISNGVEGAAFGGIDGQFYVFDGTTVRTHAYGAGAWAALTGTLSTSAKNALRPQLAYAEAETAILHKGNLYKVASGAVSAFSDADFATLLSNHNVTTGFSSVATLGQRLLFTYGRRFGYSDSLDFDSTNTLSFYTGEANPDGTVAGKVLGRDYWLFNTKTIEQWFETGDNDAPFRPNTNLVVPRGALNRDSIVEVAGRLLWIGDDRNIYSLPGFTGVPLNKGSEWVQSLLNAVSDPDSIWCSSAEIDGHLFYVINAPGFCYWMNVLTGDFHRVQTLGSDAWEWAHMVQVDGRLFAGSRGTSRMAEISSAYVSDYQADASTLGTEIARTWTAHLPVLTGRPVMSTIRMDAAKGTGQPTGEFTDPLVGLSISRDRGNTFSARRYVSTGAQGEYNRRVIWHRNGRAEPDQTVLRFDQSDPVLGDIYGVVVGGI